jgi:hypothetical protein
VQRSRLLLVVLAAGCGFRTSALQGDAGADAVVISDAQVLVDAPLDGPSVCVGRFVQVCREEMPVDLRLRDAETINTDTDPRCVAQNQGANQPTLCVITANDLRIDNAITVIGTRPLVLAAFNDLNITPAGAIILSSPRGMPAGPGANDPACNTPTPGADSADGAGGGAGGSFGGSGGPGGAGGGPTTGGAPGAPLVMPTRVTGGCPGSKGGNAGATQGGAPGNGGGAVMLIAANRLTIGSITAAGCGGSSTAALGGGGGGGSGGFVGFDAATYMTSNAFVTANGGGGGSGGVGAIGGAGQDGQPSITSAAAGGVAALAASGGTGSITPFSFGSLGNPSSGGASGGGGSAGVILVKSTQTIGGSYSPPPTYVP